MRMGDGWGVRLMRDVEIGWVRKVSGVLEERVGQQRPWTFDLDKAPRAVLGKM